MADVKAASPAPYDWHEVKQFLPPIEEAVVIHQLFYGWAVWTGANWMFVDRSGNRSHLAWQPEYWRREYHPQNPEVPDGRR